MGKGFLDRLAESLGLKRHINVEDLLRNPLLKDRFLDEKGCPSPEELWRLREHGLYEVIAWFRSRGCEAPQDLESELVAFFLMLGRPDYIPDDIRPDIPPGLPMVAVCSEGRLLARYGDTILDSGSLSSAGASRILSNSDPSAIAAAGLKASILLHWGCDTDYPRVVDIPLLALIAIPETGGALWSAVHHFDVSTSDLTLAVAEILVKSVSILEMLDVEWQRLPWSVRLAREAASELSNVVKTPEPAATTAGQSGLIASDRPRYIRKSWQPYKIEPPSVYKHEGLDYAALLAVASLSLRGGSVEKAIVASRANPVFHEKLLEAIRSSDIMPRANPPRPGDAIHSSIANTISSSNIPISLDCLKPVDLCMDSEALEPWRESMPRDVYVRLSQAASKTMENISPAGASTGGKSLITVHGWSGSSVLSLLGLKARISDGEPKVKIVSPAKGGFSGIVATLEYLVQESSRSNARILVITPDGEIASLLASSLDAYKGGPPDRGLDRWAVEGGTLVATWSTIAAWPEIHGLADTTVAVLPEVILRDKTAVKAVKAFYSGRASFVEVQASRVKEMLARLGAVGVSWLGENQAPVQGQDGSAHTIQAERVYSEFRSVFSELWGGGRLRPAQEAVLKRLANLYASGSPATTMVVLPTGYGKSLIFQVPSRALARLGFGALTLVVSPLKALMRDQTRGALKRGLVALYIDSSLAPRVKEEVLKAASTGLADLLYVSPERFEDERIVDLVNEEIVSIAVLDEAHTLSRWGETFRSSYLYMAKTLAEARSTAGWPPILALTATATLDIVESVMSMLGDLDYEVIDLDEVLERSIGLDPRRPAVFKVHPVRDNIAFEARVAPPGPKRLDTTADIARELTAWANFQSGSWVGVVFTGFVKSRRVGWANADVVAKRLEQALGGVEVSVYHGQMGEASRRLVEQSIGREGARSVVVATKAFGMGVDIPNIRWTLHVYPSDSIEDLVQEVGRAGRDGNPSRSIILFNPEDIAVRRSMALTQLPRLSRVIMVYNALVSLYSGLGINPIVLPTRSLPWGRNGLRILDVLRASGMLDYTIARRVYAYHSSEKWVHAAREAGIEPLAMLPGDVILLERRVRGAEWLREVTVRVSICRGEREVTISYGSAVPGKGDCRVGTIPSNDGSSHAIIYLNPHIGHKPWKSPPPELLVYSGRLSSLELLKLGELSRLLEEAAAAPSPAASNKVFRKGIKEYFSKPLLKPMSKDPGVLKSLPRILNCPSLSRCRDAEKILETLEELVGPTGYTVAVDTSEMKTRFLEIYGNGDLTPRIIGSKRVSNLLGRNDLLRLADYGYIVVFTARSRTAESIEASAKISGYPYITLTRVKTPI